MTNSILITTVLLFVIGYIVLYFGSRKYLEHFGDCKNKRFNSDGSPHTEQNMIIYPPENPI